jgi:hypothetical protein
MTQLLPLVGAQGRAGVLSEPRPEEAVLRFWLRQATNL